MTEDVVGTRPAVAHIGATAAPVAVPRQRVVDGATAGDERGVTKRALRIIDAETRADHAARPRDEAALR
ncbi:MAG TPA: hypothetical protein VGH04_01650, partial [Gemmatimonadaceae bacterium]